MIYILNIPILTNYGVYEFKKISTEDAQKILSDGKFLSTIGHSGTAKVLSAVLNIPIALNRIAIEMEVGDSAVVFRILRLLEDGRILTEDELKAIPYELGLLNRIS